MGKSYRQPYVKIGASGPDKRLFTRQSRRAVKNSMRSQPLDEEFDLPNPKIIVNDYDICDWKHLDTGEIHTRK